MDAPRFPPAPAGAGELLRRWRRLRRRSQLDLALDAEVSPRHLSCVETGRAVPGRELLMRLAEHLQVPLAERNTLLLAAGYAPAWPRRTLDDPALRSARDAIQRLLTAHEPYPALAVDRHWNLLAHNRMVGLLLQGVDAELLRPPVNVIRLCLSPRGLAPAIGNLAQWRQHLLARLRQAAGLEPDPLLRALLAELEAAGRDDAPPPHGDDGSGLVLPLHLRTPAGDLNLIGTITVFGTPHDVLLSELAIESFFPADEATAEVLRRLMAQA